MHLDNLDPAAELLKSAEASNTALPLASKAVNPQPGSYQVLVVDPPWNQGKTGKRSVRPNQDTKLSYGTMEKESLLALPVGTWAADQSFLWIWATNSKDKKTGEPILKTAFDLMEAWGFTFYTMVTWNKKTGPCPFGPYQITTEHVLFGYKGKAVFDKARLGKLQTCFTESPTVHSAKPDSFYRGIAESFQGKRLDVFARQVREGFDGWGNEYGTLTTETKRTTKRNLDGNNHGTGAQT